MSTKFTTGEFAKLHHVSKQTLIYYDKINLFKPKIQDPITGYRYYALDQMELFTVIHLLKELDLPLKTIKEFLAHRTTANTIHLLESQQENITKKIEHLKKISTQIGTQLHALKEVDHLADMDTIAIRYQEAKALFTQSVASPGYALEVEISIKQLLGIIAKEALPVSRQIGVIIDYNHLKKEDFLCTKYTFTLPYKTFKSNHLMIMPEGLYGTIFHKGPYKDIGPSYKRLLRYIADSGHEIIGDSYELCVVDSFTASTEEDYITQISIPVRTVL